MSKVIHWFRQDLRLGDNPALCHAAKQGKVLPVYILDDESAGTWAMGSASRVWLHHALSSLNQSLDGKLCVLRGDAATLIPELVEAVGATGVYWNRCYEPWRIKQDEQIESSVQQQGIEAESFNGSLLWEPWESVKDNGEPYKVFTPYYKKMSVTQTPREPLQKPRNLALLKSTKVTSLSVKELGLLPDVRWDKDVIAGWDVSEEGAKKLFYNFREKGLAGYKEGRNFPAKKHVSRLSPYLHFGMISPHQMWYAARFGTINTHIEHFCMELGWREFAHNLLYHFPTLPKKSLQPQFEKFPWEKSKANVKAWQKGQTGFPIVDAGMRELWQTGYMHNRVRMIVGSFLVKNLLIHWHEGEKWFWDCLFDADLANNSTGWQWIAGCGADAAPYFRVFNPVLQGEKFDADGEYTRKYVPELAKLPDKYLFKPWEAPADVLEYAGVKLGVTYPKPIVDVKLSRDKALAAYQKIKRS